MITIRLIRSIGTIDIAITDPDIGHTTIVATLELILFADKWRAASLILTARTITYTIATLHTVHTEGGTIPSRFALKMILEACELIAIQLIRIVATLIDTITNGRGMYTLLVAALILSRLTVEGWTRLGLIAAITTIILRIAAPIEWNAFVCVDALKVGSRAIGPTCASILGKHKIIGTGALVVRLDGRQ